MDQKPNAALALINSRKTIICSLLIVGVVVLAATHNIKGDDALAFVKWMAMVWVGSIAVEDAAEKYGNVTKNITVTKTGASSSE